MNDKTKLTHARPEAFYDDEEAGAELRWEKGVEFALARELQAWHVDTQLRKALEAQAGPAAALPDPDADRVISPEKLLGAVAALCRKPRYLPLDGNAEKTLGDALAGAAVDRLLLIECKRELNESAWKSEALPETRTGSGTEKESVSNQGGKNRQATLGVVRERIWPTAGKTESTKDLGHQCHFLVTKNPAPQGGAADPALVFADYWNFVFRENGVWPATHPIAGIRQKGLALEKFRFYVFALLEEDLNTSSGDAAWIARELILLAGTDGASSDTGSWHGGRISAIRLAALLDLDLVSPGFVARLKQREAEERRKKKQQLVLGVDVKQAVQHIHTQTPTTTGPGSSNP